MKLKLGDSDEEGALTLGGFKDTVEALRAEASIVQTSTGAPVIASSALASTAANLSQAEFSRSNDNNQRSVRNTQLP